MAKRGYIQFYPEAAIEQHLVARSKASGQSLHLTARDDLERYYQLLAAERKTLDFTEAELSAILDACNGVFWEPWSIDLIWAQVAEAEGLTDKWEIDRELLIGRLRRLTPGQKFALVDAIERYWGGVEGDVSTADGLRRVGLLE